MHLVFLLGLEPRRLVKNTLVNFQSAEPRFDGEFSISSNTSAEKYLGLGD
jgi:hypothetical protein